MSDSAASPVKHGFVRRNAKLFLLLGAAFFTCVGVGLYKAHDYTENNPKFCNSCHSMDAAIAAWQTSIHSSVNCHGCHESSMSTNLHNLWVTVLEGQEDVEKHAEVPSERCETCHVGEDPSRDSPRLSAGHRSHVGEAHLACVECHSEGVHQFVVPSQACVRCHEDRSIQSDGMSAFHCTSCHNYSSTEFETVAGTVPDSCRSCHIEMGVADASFPTTPDAPHAQLTCPSCHNPHEQARPTRETCIGCHDRIPSQETHSAAGHDTCTGCHQPHAFTPPATADCRSCHDVFTPEHMAEMEGMDCNLCHDFRLAE